MNRDTTKDFQLDPDRASTHPSHGEQIKADVLHFCIDQEGFPFGFVFNGIPLGDQIAPECHGLPENMYNGYISFQGSFKKKFISSDNGNNELTKTVCFDGEISTFLYSRFSLPGGNKAKVLISIRDITALHNLAGQNNINEIMLGLVIENMPDVFCIFDMKARLTFISPSVEQFIGYKVNKLMEFPLTEIVAPDTRKSLEDAFRQLLELKKKCLLNNQDKEPLIIEVQFITASNDLRWAEISLAPYAGHDNKIKGIYGIIRDISAFKLQQEEMKSSLQYEIERGKVKSKYISSISHEFRTPLSIIYSNLQLLESHQHELDEETIADSYDLSKMAVKSLLRVLDKVTIIDASGKGKLEFKPALVHFDELVHSVVNDLNEMEIVPGRVKVNVDPAIGQVYIDEYLFRHIFTNLLHNALNYSDKKQFVQMNVASKGADFLAFEIKDNGIGIPQEDMGLLFEPFYRASNARSVKGSGLGLSVINTCLELHHGTISIESEVGQGTVVKVVLPIAQMNGHKLENDI